MAGYVVTPTRTFIAAASLGEYLYVYDDGTGTMNLCGVNDVGAGTVDGVAFNAGDAIAVRLHTAQGTRKVVASGAIAKGAFAYQGAAGKVASSGAVLRGIALDASAADGDIIEILPVAGNGGRSSVVVDADGAALMAADSGKTYYTDGAIGAATFVLPVSVPGLEYTFQVGAAQELRVDPNGTETIGLPSTGVQAAAGKYISADAVGEWVKVRCLKAGKWTVQGYAGTWTAEA